MTNYRKQFDDRLAQINSAIDSMSGTPEVVLPGLTKQRIRRFFQRFSVLFGRLDKSGPRHPQFLTFPGTNVPDAILANIDSAISQMESGASTFITNSMVPLSDLQEKLERAVGLDPAALNQLSIATAKDLAAAVGQSDELLRSVEDTAAKMGSLLTTANAQQASIQQSQKSIKTDVDAIAELRARADTLLSVDGRQKSSLESLVRRVQAKGNYILDKAHA